MCLLTPATPEHPRVWQVPGRIDDVLVRRHELVAVDDPEAGVEERPERQHEA